MAKAEDGGRRTPRACEGSARGRRKEEGGPWPRGRRWEQEERGDNATVSRETPEARSLSQEVLAVGDNYHEADSLWESRVGRWRPCVGGWRSRRTPEYGDGSDDLQDDDEVNRWHRTLCKTPRAYAKYIHAVWRWTWETCVALHPHSPIWQLIANGTFRGQHSTLSLVGSDPLFLLTIEVKVDDLEDHYARAGVALQILIKAQGRSGRLLEDVPRRRGAPVADRRWSRPSATDPAELRGNATDKMMRLIAKYAFQFRRPWPYHEMMPHIKNSATMHVRYLPHGALEVLRGQIFSV